MIGHQTRHSKEDALNQREFQLLLEGAMKLDDYYAQQARFVILVGGRLGLRRGEMSHMEEDWIHWRRNMIEIPRHEPCDRGRGGGICGYCRNQANQRAEHNRELSVEKAEQMQWKAKTDEAAREVPFGFDPRVSLCIERFFEQYDKWPCSSQAINRRLNKAAEAAEEVGPDDVYPHCLRATAASFHAARGLDVIPLQSLMGWAQVSTAHNYVKKSGENTKRALHYAHNQ